MRNDYRPISSLNDLILEAADEARSAYALDEGDEKGLKASLYHKTAVGSIGKVECFITDVNKDGVTFIPARGRSERTLMSYYDPWWMIVAGWGHPSPDGAWRDGSSNQPGLTIHQSKYRRHDDRWVSDFLEGPGKSLKPLAIYDGNKLEIHGKVPQKQVEHRAVHALAEAMGIPGRMEEAKAPKEGTIIRNKTHPEWGNWKVGENDNGNITITKVGRSSGRNLDWAGEGDDWEIVKT
jgi:hypothetical protein